MTFAQRRNCVTTHFSERILVVKRRISVFGLCIHIEVFVERDRQVTNTGAEW